LELPIVVVLDEAYVEFYGETRGKWVEEHANLIVLRTFSKWAGLAGLRVGYGIFPKEIITHLWKIKQPYNVNVAAMAATLASLHDLECLRQNVTKIIAERERLYQELTKFEFLQPYPSQATFILCRVIGRDAYQLKLDLEQKGILVRYYTKPELLDCIRISIGRPEHTDRLITEMKEL
jgi:histidinol-phosphate aminotransferase